MKTIRECTSPTGTNFKTLLARLAGIVFFCFGAVTATAQTYTVMHSFGTNVMGLYPYAPLVQGPDGTLYGTTIEGGMFDNMGQVFKVNADGSGYTVLKDFNGLDGANPEAGLVLSGSTLYGTTREGGTNWYGFVFKIQTDGNGFELLKEFAGDDGAEPQGGLTLSGTTLFGTTASGGTNGYGIVFKLQTDGSGFTVLKHFSGDDGAFPHADLALSGTGLFGTTPEGGSNNCGTVFRLNTDGSEYRVLHSFTEPNYSGGEGTNSDGAWPAAGLALAGTKLFGTTPAGGANGHGVVFTLNTDGSGFAVLKDFTGVDGRTSCGNLLLSGAALYGTTAEGGSNWSGNVFKLNTAGSGFEVLKELNGEDGISPCAGLYLSNTTLFGTTSAGGRHGFGTVFKLDTNGSAYTVVTHFAGGDGGGPNGNLLLSGTTLYGTTIGGGSSGIGTLFKINADGSSYTQLKKFTNQLDGVNPNSRLVLSGTTLFGTTDGSSIGNGVVFKVNTDGSGFSVLRDFTNSTEGAGPRGMVLSDTTLFGTTGWGGSNGNGTVFKIGADGTGFTVLKHFTGSDGADPFAGLLLSGTTLYGTAAWGGSSSRGTVFKINTDGSNFAVMKNFAGSDGENPYTGLVLLDTTLYGTACAGGSFGNGTVFKINTDGSGFAVLKHFTGSDGANPQSALLLSGTTLYGATSWGGGVGNGTVFQVNIDGSNFSVLKHFTGSDGNYPVGGLVLSGTTLYGTTGGGGNTHSGVLFSLSPGLATIVLQPASQTVKPGDTVNLQVTAGGWPSPDYQWYLNGTNIINGATNPVLAMTDVTFFHSGNYTVVVTNMYGSLTSAVASLIVEDPFINTQPRSQFLIAGQTCRLSVGAGGTSPLGYQWFKDGMILNDGGNISGALTPMLTLSNVLGGGAGRYAVVISNGYSSVTSLVAVLAVLTQPELVVNGSFESPVVYCYATFTTIPGWTTSFGRGIEIQNDCAGTAFDGQQLVELDSEINSGMVQQIPTIPGQAYQLGFAYSPRPGYPRASNGIDVFFDNTLLASITEDGMDLSDTRWSIFTWSVVAGGSSSRLEFRATGASEGVGGYVDDVHLTSIGPATITVPPASQTAELGSTVRLSVHVTNSPPLAYQWFFNGTNAISDTTTNSVLELTNLQPANGGTYTVVIHNAFAAVTSSPAMLAVIPSVERRLVPGVSLTSDGGSILQLDYTDTLSPSPIWLPLATISMEEPPQRYFDVTEPLPTQRFYRASHVGEPGAILSLDLQMIPALTLTGTAGDAIRVDGINRVGPVDAWFTLDTVTLTNMSQIYFDVTAPDQPPRLYRLAPMP